MNLNERKSSRRNFLGAATALSLATVSGQLKANAGSAFVSNPEAGEEWFTKIKGKHKIVFDAPEHNGGMPLAWPRVFQMTNSSDGKTDDLGIVVIFRHNGLPLAFEDRLWEKYNLGEAFKINDPATNAPSKRNFYWKPQANALPIPGMAINELMESGVLFATCLMAIFHYSGIVAKKMGLDHETVRKDWIAGILPGIQPQPSGVFAVNRAQEHGCTYCFAG